MPPYGKVARKAMNRARQRDNPLLELRPFAARQSKYADAALAENDRLNARPRSLRASDLPSKLRSAQARVTVVHPAIRLSTISFWISSLTGAPAYGQFNPRGCVRRVRLMFPTPKSGELKLIA